MNADRDRPRLITHDLRWHIHWTGWKGNCNRDGCTLDPAWKYRDEWKNDEPTLYERIIFLDRVLR